MALNTVTLTWDFSDFLQAGISDTCILYLTPSFVLADTTDSLIIPAFPRSVTFTGGSGSLAGIVANDNVNLAPAGSAYSISVFDPASNRTIIGPFSAQINHATGATQDLSALYENQVTPPSPTFNYLKSQSNLSDLNNVAAAQANLGVVGVFSPKSYGAVGDGTTDDTTAVRACVAAAIAAQGVVDFGPVNFRTTGAITINGQVKMRGSVGYTKGGIVNSASDIFTVTNGANVVLMENCSFTSQAGGGHIFQASGANVSDWSFRGTWCQQSNAAKAIWYQYQGGMFDFMVDDNCFWQCAPAASVSPVSFLAMPGNCNGLKFGRGRYTGSATMTVPWFTFYPDAGAHTDTNVGFTSGQPTVTDANAVAADLGLKVIHATFSGGSATIISVNPGVGYTVNANAGGNLSAQTALIGLQGWYEEIKFDHCTFEVMPTGAIWANGIYDMLISDIACWDVTATQDVYHFYKGITGYRCQNITVRGGRGGPVTGGASNFFADSNCVNIYLESFGQGWGAAPVLSSPSGQTTIVNGVNGVATPVAQFPSLQLPQVTIISATGNTSYTPPTGTQILDVTLVAGGGGGGSGAFAASGNTGGGGGGGGGALSKMQLQASTLTSSITVGVGAGGNGGAAVTGAAGGNAGSTGTSTTFGPYFYAKGGAGGAAGIAAGGAAGGGGGGVGTSTGGAGGGSIATAGPGANSGLGPTTGGAGGGSVAGTTVAVGSNGGTIANVATWSNPSAGVLDVASITGLPTSGTCTVAASGSTLAVITYTGVATGQLTGCAYVSGSPAGTVATGGVVDLAWNGGATSAPVLGAVANTAAGGIVGGASPTNGTTVTPPAVGPGGGGGASALSGAAQQGADAQANSGAGGGGGGSCQNGTSSGKGGAGGSGYAIIIAYFQ